MDVNINNNDRVKAPRVFYFVCWKISREGRNEELQEFLILKSSLKKKYFKKQLIQKLVIPGLERARIMQSFKLLFASLTTS